MINAYDIAEYIKANRKYLAMQQKELAQILGITMATISKWETGQMIPSLTNMVNLAYIFGVTIDEFLGCYYKDDIKKYEILELNEYISDNEELMLDDLSSRDKLEVLKKYIKYLDLAKHMLKDLWNGKNVNENLMRDILIALKYTIKGKIFILNKIDDDFIMPPKMEIKRLHTLTGIEINNEYINNIRSYDIKYRENNVFIIEGEKIQKNENLHFNYFADKDPFLIEDENHNLAQIKIITINNPYPYDNFKNIMDYLKPKIEIEFEQILGFFGTSLPLYNYIREFYKVNIDLYQRYVKALTSIERDYIFMGLLENDTSNEELLVWLQNGAKVRDLKNNIDYKKTYEIIVKVLGFNH